MKEIVILGKGENSRDLAVLAVKAANDLEIDYQLQQTDDQDEIIGHGVIVTPAIVIDGKVAFSGTNPTREELKKDVI